MDSEEEEKMKKFLVFLIIFCVCLPAFATAPDRRISDGDGDVLGIKDTRAEIVDVGDTLKSAGISPTAFAVTQLSATSVPIVGVTINADIGDVWIGGSDVTIGASAGYLVSTGEVVRLKIDDLSDVYVITNTSDRQIFYIAELE